MGDSTDQNKKDEESKEAASTSAVQKEDAQASAGGSDRSGNRTVSDIFSQLQSLFNITQAGSLIKPDYINSSLLAYGPRELKCISFTEVPLEWQVREFGDDAVPHLQRKSFGLDAEGSWVWKDIDGFVAHKLDIFNKVLMFSQRIMIEPEKELTSGGLRYKPSSVGVPSGLFVSGQCGVGEEIRSGLDSFLTPMKSVSTHGLNYFKDINVAMSSDLCRVVNLYFQLVNVASPEIIRRFERQYRIVSDGDNPGFYPLTIDRRIKYYPAASPVNLNMVFQLLPRGGELSYAMLCNTVTPDVRIVPANSVTLATQMGMTTTRASIALQLSNYAFKSSMDAGFYAYISYFFAPGFTNLEVDFSELNPGDDTRFVIALMSKLIFQYDGSARWRNLTMRSARDIDAIILNTMQTEGLIEHIANAVTRDWENFVPVRRVYSARYWAALRTDELGRGWMSAGHKRYSAVDPSIYMDCARRQIYVVDWDRKITAANENELPNPMDNQTYQAVMEVLDAMHRRPGYREIKQFFQYCYVNFTRFMCSVNCYNRLNWYSGFRITENQAELDVTYRGITKISSISAEAVAVMFRSLNEKSVAERRVSYPIQFQMESAFMYDYIMYCVLTNYTQRIIDTELKILDEFSSQELVERCLPEPGPLRDFILYLQQYHLVGQISVNLDWLMDDELLVQFFNVVQDVAWRMGEGLHYTSDLVLIDKLNNLREEMNKYKNCAQNNTPYSSNLFVKPASILTNAQVLELIRKGRAMTTIRELMPLGVGIKFPIPLMRVASYVSFNDRYPIEVDIGAGVKTIRKSIRCESVALVSVSASRALLDDFPDLCSLIVPIRQNCGLPSNIRAMNIYNFRDWCKEIYSLSGKIHCVQLGNLEFRSVFGLSKPGVMVDQIKEKEKCDQKLWALFADFFMQPQFVPVGWKN